MCCGGGDQTTTQKQSPWGPTKEPLKGAITDLGAWYAGPSPQYYPGQTVAGFNPTQANAFHNIINTSQSPGLQQATKGFQNFASGAGAGSAMLGRAGSGYGDFAGGGGAGAGLLNQAGGGYSNIAYGTGPGSKAVDASIRGYNDIGQGGGPGTGYEVASGRGYGLMADQGTLNVAGHRGLESTAQGAWLNNNPYVDAMFGQAAGQVRGQTAGTFEGAGRYHSGAHEDVQERNDNALATNIYGGNYANERANMMGAGQFLQGQAAQGYQNLQSLGGQRTGEALSGLGGLLASGGQKAGTALQALQGQQSVAGQQAGNALSGLGGQVGVAGQQAANQMAGDDRLAGVDAARIANLGQGANVGQLMQGQQQQEIDANRQRYDWNQNSEAMKIQQYMQSLLGAGGQFGSTSSTQPGVPWWQQALGYGLSGASVAQPFFR